MENNNIILIGMPGVGKSTIGVILAKVLGYQFIDADLLIQKEEGQLLKDIIHEKGTDGFIQVENRVNSQIQTERSVIATGGSVIYGKEAMEHLKSIGVVVYLKQNLWHLEKRLRNIKGRGVVLKPGQTLADLYNERTVLYEKYADIIVDEHGLDIEETLEAVKGELQNYAPWFADVQAQKQHK
jgi:shikimate kinase